MSTIDKRAINNTKEGEIGQMAYKTSRSENMFQTTLQLNQQQSVIVEQISYCNIQNFDCAYKLRIRPRCVPGKNPHDFRSGARVGYLTKSQTIMHTYIGKAISGTGDIGRRTIQLKVWLPRYCIRIF